MGGPTTNPTAKLMLADLYRRRNQAARAEKLYAELLKTPTAPAVAAAAAFYASTGRAADADAALQRLSDIKNLDPGAKELVLAEHYATYGKPEQATEQYKAAVKAAPGNANIWRSFLVYCVRAGRIDEALANAEEATKACPANKTFANFSALAKELKLVAAERAFVPLIVSVLQSSTDSETAAAVIRIGAEALQAKQTPAALAAKLRPLADRAPNLVGLQALLIQSYMLADRLDEAAAIAQRSAKASPASAEIAQLAAKVLAASGDYRQAIVAASRWRELSLNDPLAADLFIAAMHLRLNDVAAASSQIMPHLESARAKPDAYRDVLLIQARILMKQGQASEADKLIWPYVTNTSPEWRKAWLDLVLSINSSPSLAAEWLDRVEKVIPESSVDERVMLAQLWQELGRQANSNEYKQKAKTILTQLSAQSGKSAQVLFTSGALEENSGNLKEAEKLYRQAIEVQPSFPAAQNNLAMVIMSLDGDLVEAAALAAKAVQAAPQVAAFHDTLAQIQAKSKDYKSAIATITKATQLEPANPAWQINLATIYDSAGDRDGLDRTLRQIDLLVRGKQLTPEYDAELKRLRARATTRSATTKPTI
jgi:Flp pilus assembly protein TadD